MPHDVFFPALKHLKRFRITGSENVLIAERNRIVETLEKSWALAEKFGVTVTHDIEIEGYKKYNLDKSLTAALTNRAQIPAFLTELGGPNVIYESFVRIGVRGIKNILAHFNMISLEEAPWISETKIKTECRLEITEDIVCNEAGIIEYFVKPGQFVKTGQPLAQVNNILGKNEETIFAKRDCYVISLIDQSVSFPGLNIVNAAVVQNPPGEEIKKEEKTENPKI